MAGLLALGSAQAAAASFNCETAGSPVEKRICEDPELSALDEQMAAWYRALRRATLPEGASVSQRKWLSERDACRTGECVERLYASRIGELQKLTEQAAEDASRNSEAASEYVVRCVPETQTLSIEERRPGAEGPSGKAPAQRTIRPGDLVRLRETASHTLLLPRGTRESRCRLGKSDLRVVVAAHVFNANVQGECGAAEPVIEATVFRNGSRILGRFPFGSCRGATARKVHRVQVDERASMLRFVVTLDAFRLPLRIEKSFPLRELPADVDGAIFDDVLTGDADVDLFIAVRGRDVEGVRQALARGAWPNARDLNGFTPMSYLWRSRWDSPESGVARDNEELVLEQIADALFSKGATADIRNREGMSLLEYLLFGLAPARVIDQALQHGADPRQDRSLRAAAQWGDSVLVGKLLALGADPNGKGPDGSTALRTAAVSGFYTHGPGTPDRPIEAFAASLRLMFEHGAHIEGAQRDGNLFVEVARHFHKDPRTRVILAELLAHAAREDLEAAYSMLSQTEPHEEGARLRAWLAQYVRP